MRLWAEVFAPDGVTLLGLVPLISVRVTRSLNQAGDVNIAVVGTDENAEFLQMKRRIRVYWMNPARGKEHIISGILLRQTRNVSQSGTRVNWRASDVLEELRTYNTFRGVAYIDQPINQVIHDLIGRVPGWVADVDLTGVTYTTTTRRFDGVNILSAIRAVARGAGMNLRLAGDRRLEVGVFGEDSGILLRGIHADNASFRANRDLILLDSLSITHEGHEVVNVIEPVWGRGAGILTLKRSDRVAPYPIQTRTQADGRTGYSIEDGDSIAAFGRSERLIQMGDAPYIDGETVINAANVLYDWAVEELTRLKEPQTIYSASGVKLDKRLLPGDKVNLYYRGEVMSVHGIQTGEEVVAGDFFALKVQESYSDGEAEVSLDLSTQGYEQTDIADDIGDMLADDAGDVGRSLIGNVTRETDEATLTNTTPIVITFTIGDLAIDVGTIRVTVTRANSAGPYSVAVNVDGVFVDGGPFFEDALAANSFHVDVDDIIADSPPIAGDHTITVTALYGSGVVSVTVEAVVISIN